VAKQSRRLRAVSSRAACCRSYCSSSETALSLPLSLMIFQKNMRINLKQSCSPNRAIQHFLKDQHEKLNSFGDFELEKGHLETVFTERNIQFQSRLKLSPFPSFFSQKHIATWSMALSNVVHWVEIYNIG
jgi:hypothetical protein